jgi:hypothetical protein
MKSDIALSKSMHPLIVGAVVRGKSPVIPADRLSAPTVSLSAVKGYRKDNDFYCIMPYNKFPCYLAYPEFEDSSQVSSRLVAPRHEAPDTLS